MKHDELVGFGGTAFGGVVTMAWEAGYFQMILAIMTLIELLITTAYTLWKWYKKASKDGKIEEKEVDELFEDLEKIKPKKEESKNE